MSIHNDEEEKKILDTHDEDEYEDRDEDEDEDESSQEVKDNKEKKKIFDFKNTNHRLGAILAFGVVAIGGLYYVKSKNTHVEYEPDETKVISKENEKTPDTKTSSDVIKDNQNIDNVLDTPKKDNDVENKKDDSSIELIDTDNISNSINEAKINTNDLPKLKKPSSINSSNDTEERLKTLEDKLSLSESNNQKIKDLSDRVEELEKKVEMIEKTDSLIQDIINERKEMEKNKEEKAIQDKIAKEGNINIDVPEFSKGKSRLIGYKILPISNDPNIILVSDNNSNIVAVSKDTGFNYKGKVLKVDEISGDGKIINFENNVFIDTTLGFGGKNNQQIKDNFSKKELTATIKKEKPKANVQDLNNIRGVALTRDNGKYNVTIEDKNNNSEMTSLKEGDSFKNFGKVKKIDEYGNIYFSKGKINFSK